MTRARPAGQDTARTDAGGLPAEGTIEVEEILPGHLDYRDGQGRAFHVWNVSPVSRWGLGKLSEAQLRELGRQIGDLLGPAADLREAPGPAGSRDRAGSGERGAVIDPQYGIPFADPAHPGSDESQAGKHRRHKAMRGPLRAAGFEVPPPDEVSLVSTALLESGHVLSFLPYGDHALLLHWTVEVSHPAAGPRGRHLEDLGTDDDLVPRRALEFLASARGSRILSGIAAGTHEGNIARDPYHPLSLDQAGSVPGEPEGA